MSDVCLGILAPRSELVGILSCVLLDRRCYASIGISLAEYGIDSTSQDLEM